MQKMEAPQLQGCEVHGTRSLATTPRKGEKEEKEAPAPAAAARTHSSERDSPFLAPRSGLADEKPASARLGFKTGSGKTLQLAEPAAESFFGGLWPELSKLGAISCQELPKLLAAPGAQLGEGLQVEAPCHAEGDSEQPRLEPGCLPLEPQEETVIPLFPPGYFPKGMPLAALLLETAADAAVASDGSSKGARAKRA